MAKAIPHIDYDVTDNTYNLKRQNLKDKGWDTEIGDRRSKNKFIPRVKIQRWDDAFIEIGVHPSLQGGGDSVTHDGDAIVWSKGIYTAKFYDWAGDPDDEGGSGSFEWEFILASEPPINSFSVDIRSENVKFYYQPALTPEEIADGVERPERVVGSYAIYHTSKHNYIIGQTNYQIGKIGHLYRPKVTDNNGDWIWGEWNDDAEATSQLTVTVDAAWLAAAAYPVVIDPTIGYIEIGLSNSQLSDVHCNGITRQAGHNITANSGDTVTKFSAYCKSYSQPDDADFAVYSVDVNGDPENRLTAAVAITADSSTSNWKHSAPVSQSLVSSIEYTICDGVSDPVGFRLYYDAGLPGDQSRDGTTGTLPATWTDGGGAYTSIQSMYATYTEGAAAVGEYLWASESGSLVFAADASGSSEIAYEYDGNWEVAPSATGWQMALWDLDSAEATMWRDGLPIATGSYTDTAIGGTTTLGSAIGAASEHFGGKIAEVILYSKETPDTEIDKLFGYAADKWWGSGVLNPLPTGHIYKDDPPASATTKTKTQLADGILLGTPTIDQLGDALLIQTATAFLTADALLLQTGTLTELADAILKGILTLAGLGDALLVKSQTLTQLADVILVVPRTTSSAADAIVVNRFSTSQTADTILVDRREQTQTADALLRLVSSIDEVADALLIQAFTKTGLADAFLVSETAKTTLADALLVQAQIISQTADALLLQAATLSGLADALLISSTTKTAIADALLVKTATITQSADAVLVGAATLTSIADALLLLSSTETGLADAILLGTPTISQLADAIIGSFVSIDMTADAILHATLTIPQAADALLVLTSTTAQLADALISLVSTKTELADAILLGTLTITQLADAIIGSFTTIEMSADAILLGIGSISQATDGLLIQTSTSTQAADAILTSTGILSGVADGLLLKTNTIAPLADALLLEVSTVSQSADAILTRAGILTSVADALLSTITTIDSVADGLLELTSTLSQTADAILDTGVATNTISQSADAIVGTFSVINLTANAKLGKFDVHYKITIPAGTKMTINPNRKYIQPRP